MRRIGNLFEAVVERENLLLAFWKASRGKAARPDRAAYARELDAELAELREGLIDGSYPIGNYVQFVIHDPKERVITAAPFRERVLQHALMNVCEPWFDRWLIFDTYASRKGKGQLAAAKRAATFASRYPWFLKCDIRKYFDSIPHGKLRERLRRKFKDGRLLFWFDRIVASYEAGPGRGVPIGNLTSQHFANFYLDPVDRMSEALGGGYVRYMDDFVFWGSDKAALLRLRGTLGGFVEEQLGLSLKGEPFLNRSARGMDFLGYRVFPGRLGLARASRDRYRRRLKQVEAWRQNGWMDDSEAQRRMDALGAFPAHASCLAWRREAHERIFAQANGDWTQADGDNRINRGGSFNNTAENCTAGNRNRNNPGNTNRDLGLRLAASGSTAPAGSLCSPRPIPVPGHGRDETTRLRPLPPPLLVGERFGWAPPNAADGGLFSPRRENVGGGEGPAPRAAKRGHRRSICSRRRPACSPRGAVAPFTTSFSFLPQSERI